MPKPCLRHAQIAITMEVYTEVPDEVTRAALKQLGDRLSRPDRSDGQLNLHRPGAVVTGRVELTE